MPRFIHRGIIIGTTLAFLVPCLSTAGAQVTSTTGSNARPVTFRMYLEAVEKNSLDLQSQRENITSAKAGISVAGIRPDPQLLMGISAYELSPANRQNASTATTAGIAVTIETGGKRGKRILSAENNVKLTEANVGEFLHQLEMTASSAFVEACRTKQALERKQSSLKSFQQIVHANEARFNVGEIGKLELRKSRVEADRFATDATSASADAKASIINLSAPLGKPFSEIFPEGVIDCNLKRETLPFKIEDLIRQALEKRNDIRVARVAVEHASANIELAHANRWVDPTVNVGVTHTPQVQPSYDSAGNVTNSPTLASSQMLGLTLSVPIPFSRLQRGELIQAETALTQAQLQLRSTLLKAETEVRAIYTQYQAAVLNVQRYSDHVLDDADRVLDGIRISYQKGSASLLELLDAQRTADDVYLSYLQALAGLANATAQLQLSVGMQPEL